MCSLTGSVKGSFLKDHLPPPQEDRDDQKRVTMFFLDPARAPKASEGLGLKAG